MARKMLIVKYFNGGLADSEKEGLRGAFNFAQNLDIYSEPTSITIQSKTAKDSGSTVVGLVKWIKSGLPTTTNTFFYDDAGHIYQRTSNGTWSDLRTVSNSFGQGLEIYADYLYYTQNTQLGRYGLLSGTPSFTDNWQTGLNSTVSTKFAPIRAFANGLAVGHGNYVGWYDGSVWDPDRLILPTGFNVRSLEIIQEMLVITAWKGSTVNTAEQSLLFFWDGASTNYNYYIETQEGIVNALINSKNRLLVIMGSSGELYINSDPFVQLTRIPLVTTAKYLEIYPGAITSWKGKTIIGVAGGTDSAAIYQGVYQYGTKTDKYPEALNFGWKISTGNSQATNIAIGAVAGIGGNLFIGWKDNTTYGVDKVAQAADPYAQGIYESMIFDDNRLVQEKQALTLKATHKALVSGESIQLGYKTNRASSYTMGTANSTVGSTTTRLPIDADKARFNEYSFECILATSGSTSPTVTSIGLEYDDLIEETLV